MCVDYIIHWVCTYSCFVAEGRPPGVAALCGAPGLVSTDVRYVLGIQDARGTRVLYAYRMACVAAHRHESWSRHYEAYRRQGEPYRIHLVEAMGRRNDRHMVLQRIHHIGGCYVPSCGLRPRGRSLLITSLTQ